MFWILVFGVIFLAVSLIITIAYLFVYIGYYTEVDVKTEPSKFRDRLIAYKGTLIHLRISLYYLNLHI